MEPGNIKITENDKHQFLVEAQLYNGELWHTEHEIARLFNVFVSKISSNLLSIFKSGIIHKKNVTQILTFENNGRTSETTLYNLEALLFVSYRIQSFEARAFREWVMNALVEYNRKGKDKTPNAIVIFNQSTSVFSVN